MSNAKRDQDFVPSIICASKNDGVTIVPIQADATTHGLMTDDHTTGSNNGNNLGSAARDENRVPVWTALSSAGDGSIVEVYADPATGAVLVNSN